MVAYARRLGIDPRRVDLEQTCTAHLLCDIVREHVDGERHTAGRDTARERLRQHLPQLAIEPTLDALDGEAMRIADQAFLDSVVAAARQVH